MTKHEKELQRSKMMWISLWGIIVVMVIALVLTLLGKDVKSLEVIISAYFTTLAGVIGTSFFSKPTPGSDDYINTRYYSDTSDKDYRYTSDTYHSQNTNQYTRNKPYNKLDLD